MKFTINVDCTAEEARTFLGLPDVSAVHENLLKDYEQRMRKAMESMGLEAMSTFMHSGLNENMSSGLKGFETLQKTLWSQMMRAASDSTPKSDD